MGGETLGTGERESREESETGVGYSERQSSSHNLGQSDTTKEHPLNKNTKCTKATKH